MAQKHSLKTILRWIAVQLKIVEPATHFPAPFAHHEIDLILDVGANVGQYAQRCREQGYTGRIVSFEPLPDAYEFLTRAAVKDDGWLVHSRTAIGSDSGDIDVNVAGNSYSSSILEMLGTHISAAPSSQYVGSVKTKLEKIDSVFPLYFKSGSKVLLKIDTQGFEAEVLEGAKESISKISLIQIELSAIQLYKGQELYHYFFDFMRSNEFELWDILPGFRDSSSGQMLQFDAFFYRKVSS